MLRSVAVEEIKEGLGFRTDLDDAIVRRMVRVQSLLEQGKTLPWFLVKEDHEITVAADGHATLPTDFIREVEYKRGLYYRSTPEGRPVFLVKQDLDEARAIYGVGTSEYPSVYVVRNERFYLLPVPTQEVVLRLDYYAKDVSLDSGDVENKWLRYAPYLIIGNAGASMAGTINRASSIQEFQRLATAAWDALLKENILREIANREYVLGRNS